jgi:hypothetical protein
MRNTTAPAHPDPQRITVAVDLLPGPLIPAVAERLLQIVADELHRSGIELTAVRIEVRGPTTTW